MTNNTSDAEATMQAAEIGILVRAGFWMPFESRDVHTASMVV
jgi:hypothetical protein